MGKKKKGSRYTPKILKSDRHKPWWERRIYRGSGDKRSYFFKVYDYLENGPVDENLILPVKNNRTRVGV